MTPAWKPSQAETQSKRACARGDKTAKDGSSSTSLSPV